MLPILVGLGSTSGLAAPPEAPRVESVVPVAVQPHVGRPSVIGYDDFVVSTQPIGPLTAASNPTVLRRADPAIDAWELQIAADAKGIGRVWESRTLPGAGVRVRADPETGTFVGVLAGQGFLPAGPMYFCRVRQRNALGE